jgi:hypothetical protein
LTRTFHGLRNYCFVFRVRRRYWRTVCKLGRKRKNGRMGTAALTTEKPLAYSARLRLEVSPTIAAAWFPIASALDALRLSSNSYNLTTLLGMGPRIARKTISGLVVRGCGDGSGQMDTPLDFKCSVGIATTRNSTALPARSRDSLTIPNALALIFR